ncbi:DUF934 domain-containing protein [Jannaschia sp. LMIT008]|uniref:DUF934 domain-containing protein n=1 Tax=Jannaschia maritima TaxID=3032585 RepID=UPI00281147A5|nr:DUF934 domain-containing protein [Jannaschia sp. LMIT008]
MPIVTDAGFGPEDLNTGFMALDDMPANGPFAVDVPPDADLAPLLERLSDVTAVRVTFPSFADGRGFTVAGILRRAGYRGRLRAAGHVLADQYAMARRMGFDEVEIDDALAARQPEGQWSARADWRAHDYQSRLRG